MNQKTVPILLMVGAIFCFASMDAVAKYLMQEIGAAQTIWARYTVQAVLVTILIFPRINVYARTKYPKLQLSRSIALMMATTLFFFAISNGLRACPAPLGFPTFALALLLVVGLWSRTCCQFDCTSAKSDT